MALRFGRNAVAVWLTLRSSNRAACNAVASPFLSLPPEIRSRIYDFVYASNTIHIFPFVPVYVEAYAAYRQHSYDLGLC